MDLLHFDRPPVTKARFTVFFELSESIQVSQLASYVEELRQTFPHVVEQAPAAPWSGVDPTNIPFLGWGSAWPFPMMVLTSPKGASISIQDDRLIVTWAFDQSEDVYPGYASMKRELAERYEGLAKAVRAAVDAEITIGRFECFYENAITEVTGADLATGVLTEWAAPSGPSATHSAYLGTRLEFRQKDREDNLSTLIAVDSSEDEDSSELWLKVTRDRPEQEENSIEGMDVAHDELIRAFRYYTSEELRKTWGES